MPMKIAAITATLTMTTTLRRRRRMWEAVKRKKGRWSKLRNNLGQQHITLKLYFSSSCINNKFCKMCNCALFNCSRKKKIKCFNNKSEY